MKQERTSGFRLFDLVALAEAMPEHGLPKYEMGAVITCLRHDAYEVEFVASDGQTRAVVTLRGDQLIPWRAGRGGVDGANDETASDAEGRP